MPVAKPTTIRIDIAADLNKWRTFLAIAELGSLTRAAIFLDSNQSLLSRQLNAMERECGARLFNRTGRGVALSDVGERIFPHVRAVLESAEQLESEVRGEAREPAGQVSLGSLPSISNPLVGRLFTRIRAAYPAVHLRVLEGSSGQIEEWLADARVDIGILYRYGPTLPAQERALACVDSYLIGPSGDRLTGAAEIAFDKLAGLPYILPGAPNGLRNALDATARARRIALTPVIEADSLPLMKLLVANERLFTVLPLHAVWQEVREGRLQAARVIDPTLQRTVSMATARTKGPGRAVAAVAREIVDLVDEMAGDGLWRSGAAGPGR